MILHFDGLVQLSHAWVRYPGFSDHGVQCPILTTVVPGFSGDLIGRSSQSKWSPFGDLYQKKNHFFVWNKLFRMIQSFPKGELILWSLYGDKLSLCRNQRMNGKKSYICVNNWELRRHNGNTSNGEVPIDKVNIKILEIYVNLNFFAQFNLK